MPSALDTLDFMVDIIAEGVSRSTDPKAVLSTEEATPLDEALVVNGQVNLHRTHPGLYRSAITLGVVNLALGLNFILLSPTFLIYDSPNVLWGVLFLALGVLKILFLSVFRRLRAVRAVMAFAVAYYLFLGVGTTTPFVEGTGSLQLPILYVSLAALHVPLLLEPFINPWTARR